MDAETLAAAMGRTLPVERYAALLPTFNAALIQAGCTTVNRAAMFSAQVGHESVGLRYMEEIASGVAYEGRKDLGNIYPGDGPRYKGRGPIQVTGRGNYGALSAWAFGKGYVPTPTYFVDTPTLLASDRYGFLGAVWYWTVARPKLNAYADAGDVDTATKAINGGTNGLADRRARWNWCLGLGTALLPTPSPTPRKRKVLPDMPERAVPAGNSGHRIVCPTGSASAVVARAWLSASFDGSAVVEVWAQKSGAAGPVGSANDAAAHRVWNVRPGDRPWLELPSGTEFVTAHVTNATGPGSIAIEQLPA